MWPIICNKYIVPISDFILGNHVNSTFKKAKRFQYSTEQEIESYQNEMISRLINRLVAEVPYYTKYFADHGLSKDDFQTIKDLKKLPVLTKTIINDHFNALQVSTHKGHKIQMKSSGSTGTQTTVTIDQDINSDVLATQLLFWDWGGFQMGSPHLQTGMSLKRGIVKKIKDILFRCHYTSAFDLTDAKLSQIVKQIIEKKLGYLFGYASSIYVIADYVSRKKITIPLKKVFTWGDCLFPTYREKIETVFGCKVQDCYGLGEGLQVAAQCEKTDHLHIAQHNVVVEITDETGTKDIPFGQLGRVIVTRLSTGPMPLVRYDTGDLAAFSGETCSCGRKLKLMSRVHGRDTDIILSPEGDRLIVHFFTQLFEMTPEIAQFQVRQGQLDKLDIYYVPGINFHKDILNKIKQQINDSTIFEFIINFHGVENIPLQKSNKRRFVISSLPFMANS